MRIIIYDPVTTQTNLWSFLRSKNYVVEHFTDHTEFLSIVKNYEFDLILLHTIEEKTSTTVSLINLIRLINKTPIIVVAPKLDEKSRSDLLTLGISDLIINPLSTNEIYLRLVNLVSLSKGFADDTLSIGAVQLDIKKKKVFVNNTPLPLSKKEYQIFEVLALRNGQVMTKYQIIDHIYGGIDEPNPKIVDVFICKIRSKLKALGIEDVIQTNWGHGYSLADPTKPIEAPQSSLSNSTLSVGV
jgi:two-component system cell cycle response regulator CtrA